MKTNTLCMSLFTMIAALFSCNDSQEYKSVDVDEFENIIADTTIVRLDVRTQDEYAEGHIEGARNLDVKSDNFETQAIESLPKDKTIAVYCRSGKRSQKAAGILSKNGFKVVELESGFNGWSDAQKKVVKD